MPPGAASGRRSGRRAWPGFTERKATPLGTLFLTLNDLDGQPFEVFAQIGQAGSDVAAFTEVIARLVPLAVHCGMDPAEVAEQLAGIGDHEPPQRPDASWRPQSPGRRQSTQSTVRLCSRDD